MKRWLAKMATQVAPEKAAQMHAKVHIQINDGVVLDTPVGNPDLWASPPPPNYVGGRARGNWQSTIGAPATGETGLLDRSGAPSRAAGTQVAQAINPGQVSYITNNVPYIERLNDGWSTQSPAQFVETNIDRVAAQFR